MGRHADKLRKVRLTAPVSAEDIAGLDLGTIVYLDGTVFTGREGVYKRAIDDGEPLPINPREVSNVNFHCSPAAAPNDDGTFRVGAVTATASSMRSSLSSRNVRCSSGGGRTCMK